MRVTKVELVINLKAAKALGVTFLLTLLPRRRGDRMSANMKRRDFITLLGGAAWRGRLPRARSSRRCAAILEAALRV
jgi:hypothetical protein